MSDDKRDAGRGFTVTDRRSAGSSATPESTPAEPTSRASSLPPIDFHTFMLSLGSSALLHLGDLESPEGGPTQPDLAMAQHTIDVIAMLQEKTRGNLNAPEAEFMESLLFDLRLRYVERSKSSTSS
jgi:hypothetical protein